MTNFFNVFLLSLVILSGRSQSEAVLLNPSNLDERNFEIEDSEYNEFENLPRPLESYSDPPESRLAKAKARRNFHERVSEPFTQFSSWNGDGQQLEDNTGGMDAFHDLEDVGRLRPKGMSEWQYGPLDVSSVSAKMKKWNLAENGRLRRNQDRYRRPVRYLDYTNSQMPFNEGKLRRKSFQAKTPEVAEKSLREEKNSLDFEYPEAEPRRKRSGKSMRRRRFFEAPLRSRNSREIPSDDPLLEYSRVRRFLDHKRAKKQIRMTSTLEAKEAAMSRVLDPNLNLDGILEPHVRKRRGLHRKKRDLSLRSRQAKHRKRRKPADDIPAPETKIRINSFEF